MKQFSLKTFNYVLLAAFVVWAGNVVMRSLLHKEVVERSSSVMPMPQRITQQTGDFKPDESTRIVCDSTFSTTARLLQQELRDLLGFDFEVEAIGSKNDRVNAILLEQREGYLDQEFLAEGYRLEVFEDLVEIQASKKAGAFYAIQSLIQLMDSSVFRGVQIIDEPKYEWRGMLLDCSRHFMEPEFVKRYIDLLARHKMNVLHWHLTEDQGWRIEIDAYPRLMEVAAWRDDGKGGRYGGYYTKAEISEIVAYAADRHVTIVPEIEMPGHSQAALAAYPELSCTGGPFKVETEWGVFREIYCAGNEQTFEFLKTVFDEIEELFPGEYIHIGADEVPKFRWENCRKCQQRMSEHNLHDEEELQAWFIGEMAAYAATKGKRLIGWDEVLEGKLPQDMTVQAWRGDGAAHGAEALELGHDLIMSPTSHAYFDYDLDAIDLEKVYSFDPATAMPEALKDQETKGRLLGGECNMWSERAPQEKVDSKVFPRILAMSEVLWSGHGKRPYQDFRAAVSKHYSWLDRWGVDYGAEAEPVTFQTYPEATPVSIALAKGVPEYRLKFSLGDSMEDYQSPIELEQDMFLTAQAYINDKPIGEPQQREFRHHRALGKSVFLKHQPDGSYLGNFEEPGTSLTDGAKGTMKFRDGNWLGFYQGRDFEAVVDLLYEQPIDSLSIGFYQYNNSWIFLPEKVDFYGSTTADQDEWRLLGSVQNEISPRQRGQFTKDFLLTLTEEQNILYIRVVAKSIGKCPDWHEASGSDTWLFTDEIEAR